MRPNIILISIDTLRVDHLSCYGYHRNTTPNIDKIAGEGVLFKNAYSTAVWTPPAHASMFTGLYPSQHGVIDQNRLSENIPTIAEILKQNGYQTAGFVNNSHVGSLVGFDRGHDDFYEVWRGLSKREIFKRIRHKVQDILGYADHGASKTNQLVYYWFNKKWDRERPFYLFIHYIDVHNPLKAPYPFRLKYLKKELRQQIDMKKIWKVAHNPLICFTDGLQLDEVEIKALTCLYDEEINYVDHKIGELINWLKKMKLYDKTLLILTADHGEHLGEHGLHSHVASLYEPVLHIPLILRYPKVLDPRQLNNTLVQLTDIIPTIFEIINTEFDCTTCVPGKSLLSMTQSENKDKRRRIIAEWEGRVPYFIRNRSKKCKVNQDLKFLTKELRMIRKGPHKYIRSSDGVEELYDLINDPGELENLATKDPITKEKFNQELDRWLAEVSSYGRNEQYEMSGEAKRNLEGLGYI